MDELTEDEIDALKKERDDLAFQQSSPTRKRTYGVTDIRKRPHDFPKPPRKKESRIMRETASDYAQKACPQYLGTGKYCWGHILKDEYIGSTIHIPPGERTSRTVQRIEQARRNPALRVCMSTTADQMMHALEEQLAKDIDSGVKVDYEATATILEGKTYAAVTIEQALTEPNIGRTLKHSVNASSARKFPSFSRYAGKACEDPKKLHLPKRLKIMEPTKDSSMQTVDASRACSTMHIS